MRADAEDIRWVPVGEAGEVRMGKQLSPSSRQDQGSHAPYLRVANVLDGWIDYSDVKSMAFSSTEREKYGLLPGDILLNEGQSLELVGRSAIYYGAANKIFFQNTLIRFRAGPDVLQEYAREVFKKWQQDGTFAAIAKKTTSIAHLGGERFAGLPFPLPTIRQQRRIVEVLEAAAESERTSQAAIAKLRTMRTSVLESSLQDLKWSTTLSESLREPVRNGFSPLESPVWTGVQMLGLGCLTAEGFKPTQLKNAPPSVRQDSSAILRDGDLLISRANTRALVGLCGTYRDVGTPCIYPDLMMRLRPASNVRSDFLEIVARSGRFRRYIQSSAQGTSESMVKISADVLRKIPIPVPELRIQEQILSGLHRFDERITAEVDRLAKLRLVQQATAIEMLNGKGTVPSP
ncbi:restriction endonuclease subunit S [Streptomyces uncialis]|uniref:restriction endonuclease subunit S n=1 Tax=Streptomyces uncialis TaxID=1048205 RepID=UPI0036603AF9